jgi:hypothetical protein
VAGSSKLPLWLRWFGLALGALTLAWLPIEDTHTVYLIIFSTLWSAWVAGWLSTRPKVSAWLSSSGWGFVLLGAVAGLVSASVAVGLVVFKAGIHAHGFLDFSNYQLARLLSRTPIWVALGAALGWVVSRIGNNVN